MKSIEPEDLVHIADEIDRHSEFNHEQLEVLMGLLLKLEDYQVTDCDLQFLADSFQTMANESEGEVDYIPNLITHNQRKKNHANNNSTNH